MKKALVELLTKLPKIRYARGDCLKYYISSNKRISKRFAVTTAIISFGIVLIVSLLLFLFVDKIVGILVLCLFVGCISIALITALLTKNSVVLPYIQVIDQEIVIFNKHSIEEKRIPVSSICSAEITTAYRYRVHTTPKHLRHKKVSIVDAIFEPKYMIFYDVDFTFLFGLYLCKENYEAFKKYLPLSQQNLKLSDK